MDDFKRDCKYFQWNCHPKNPEDCRNCYAYDHNDQMDIHFKDDPEYDGPEMVHQDNQLF